MDTLAFPRVIRELPSGCVGATSVSGTLKVASKRSLRIAVMTDFLLENPGTKRVRRFLDVGRLALVFQTRNPLHYTHVGITSREMARWDGGCQAGGCQAVYASLDEIRGRKGTLESWVSIFAVAGSARSVNRVLSSHGSGRSTESRCKECRVSI